MYIQCLYISNDIGSGTTTTTACVYCIVYTIFCLLLCMRANKPHCSFIETSLIAVVVVEEEEKSTHTHIYTSKTRETIECIALKFNSLFVIFIQDTLFCVYVYCQFHGR